MKKMNFLLFFMLINSFLSEAQKPSEPYWEALRAANKYYDKADYNNAVAAYTEAFKLKDKNDYANHRLFAAAANCMIDNEAGVRENLFAIVPISTKNDMKKVLVNYEIFNKYKETNWWKTLQQQMDERLENLIAHHKNLKIFKHGRNIVYRGVRINELGDTLANTLITLIPDGTGWGDEAASSQSQVIYEYQYSRQDSLDHIDELIEIVDPRFWSKYDTTGVIENEEEVWIHPIRNNEFFKTELAPFPKVLYPISNKTMKEKGNSKIMILNNWGTYTGSYTENAYQYIGETERNYGSVGKLTCHKFTAEAYNNFHGISTIEYFFSEDLGFVEMNYITYDKDKIQFVIEEQLQMVGYTP